MGELTIRLAVRSDAAAIRPLLLQLGYDLDAEEVRRRLAAVQTSADHAAMIAELPNGHVVGLLHVYARPAIEKSSEAVVQALVIDEASRQSGLGKSMMAYAERWAANRGYASVSLASYVSRDGAHAFYRALGYEDAGTSNLFRKELSC